MINSETIVVELDMVAHVYNPSTQEAEVGDSQI
jgi:hypothetical protein